MKPEKAAAMSRQKTARAAPAFARFSDLPPAYLFPPLTTGPLDQEAVKASDVDPGGRANHHTDHAESPAYQQFPARKRTLENAELVILSKWRSLQRLLTRCCSSLPFHGIMRLR